MLIQIVTVDRSKRPAAELEALAARLRTRGHHVVIHRFTAASVYAGHSADAEAVIEAIWSSDRACFRYARQQKAPCTLVLEDDCELTDLGGIDVAESFMQTHEGPVDLSFSAPAPIAGGPAPRARES
jgi:hypothetical protein